jgi:indolepyruvate ferredoxin oxidoreductase beta subunit
MDYQDTQYAEDFLERVAKMAKQPGADANLVEAYAQHLSNWMTYEDGARVAQLKTRPERFERIKQEFGVTGDQRFVVTDYLVPDMEQILGGLPKPIANLAEKIGRMFKSDFDAMKFPIQMNTNGFWGYATMRGISMLRGVRRSSRRYGHEQILLARWEAAIVANLKKSPQLGALAADAGRIVKGYGRVRTDALNDFWIFLDEGLPRIERLVQAGGSMDTLGSKALALLAKEAASAPVMRAFLDAEEQRIKPA